MKNLIFFETSIWQNVKEICRNKLLHDLVIGIYSNRHRHPDSQIISPRLSSSKALHALYKDQISSLRKDAVLWNTSFVFDKNLFEALNEGEALVSNKGIWIAVKPREINDDLITALYNEDISGLPFNTKTAQCTDFRSYENIIKGVQHTIHSDMELYLQRNPALVEVKKDVFIHKDTQIGEFTDFDSSGGKIIIDKNTKVTSFTLIEGPVFVGRDCLVTRAFLRPFTAIGRNCRVAGELSLTTINKYSNKSHEGCVALSYIGSWVNLGSGTECATLKYTFTPNSFVIGSQKIPTSMIGCGTIFNDWALTGVGTLMPSAAILGLGTMQSENPAPKYTKPFAWNGGKWDFQKWTDMVQTRLSTKNIIPSDLVSNLYKELYDSIL